MECLTLAGTLHSERPIYGLQARGLDGEEQPHSHVEDMAREYIPCIRSVQPEGPYALVGFSFGGLVAFEIARQLSAAGERIETLCLLDTYVHERCLPLGDWTRHAGGIIAERVREWRALAAGERLRYVIGKTRAVADHVRLRLGRRARHLGAETAGLPPALMNVRESMRVAMTTYKPRSYDGSPILYVQASICQDNRSDPMPVWRRVARRGLHVTQVEGRHNDLVIEPQLRFVAETLARTLSQA
jgi:acetoacetyl-CoA synthetase